jgi:phosphatidate cytidylyltransferase
VTRVLSALVLLPVVVGTIWFWPDVGTLVLALVASVLAFWEYRTIAAALHVDVPAVIGGAAVMAACFAIWCSDRTLSTGFNLPLVRPVELVLFSTFIVTGVVSVGRGRPSPGALADAAATAFAPLYLGLPLGALAALGIQAFGGGRLTLLLLIVVIVVSDSAQYYAGRAFGRRPLSPSISPKKTVEGAIGGLVFGTAAFAIGGHRLFGVAWPLLVLAGAVIAALGMVGDLFESLLKRSAGVKDSSNLIPGHGGVLDRIDSWLFAAPVYYVFVRYIAS